MTETGGGLPSWSSHPLLSLTLPGSRADHSFGLPFKGGASKDLQIGPKRKDLGRSSGLKDNIIDPFHLLGGVDPTQHLPCQPGG